jgi:glycine cleavage system protein P-like pyridoxal-binding family
MAIESWNSWLDKTSLCSHLAMLLQRISKSAALNFRPSGGSDANLLGLWMIEEVYVNWDERKIVLFSKNSWLYIASNT